MTTDWSEFVISSFAEALGWNYTPKQTTKQAQSQQIQNQQTNQVENLSSNQITWTCSCGIVNNGNITIDNVESHNIYIEQLIKISTDDDSTIIDSCNYTGVITVNDEQIEGETYQYTNQNHDDRI